MSSDKSIIKVSPKDLNVDNLVQGDSRSSRYIKHYILPELRRSSTPTGLIVSLVSFSPNRTTFVRGYPNLSPTAIFKEKYCSVRNKN
jgi:hypothetical protein